MATEKFLWRHIGPRPEDIENMLKVVGVSSLDELIEQTVPESIQFEKNVGFAGSSYRVRVYFSDEGGSFKK